MTGGRDTGSPRRVIDFLIVTGPPYEVERVPPLLYMILAGLTIALLYLDKIEQAGVAGAYAAMWTIGLFLFAIGERVWILKTVLGGGLVVAYGGAAAIAYSGLVSQAEVSFLQSQMIGNRFMYFLLAALVTSSILSVPLPILRKALVSIAPIILGGLVFAAGGALLSGWSVGMPTGRIIMMYFLPIMGGGTGAGAIPMSEIFADVTGGSASEYFNFAIAVLILGNLVAIITASLVSQIVRRFENFDGRGSLVRGGATASEEREPAKPQDTNTHAAAVLTSVILLSGVLLAETIGLLHMFAWVTLIAIALSFTRVISSGLQESMRLLSTWGMKAFIVTILVAFGLSADFEVISTLLTPGSMFVIVSTVVSAALGAGVTSLLVNCYPFEGSLAGGLCMANAGGSGDLQVLGAARRLELYPYAQISSRLGGAFMLILGSFLFEIFAQ